MQPDELQRQNYGEKFSQPGNCSRLIFSLAKAKGKKISFKVKKDSC